MQGEALNERDPVLNLQTVALLLHHFNRVHDGLPASYALAPAHAWGMATDHADLLNPFFLKWAALREMFEVCCVLPGVSRFGGHRRI